MPVGFGRQPDRHVPAEIPPTARIHARPGDAHPGRRPRGRGPHSHSEPGRPCHRLRGRRDGILPRRHLRPRRHPLRRPLGGGRRDYLRATTAPERRCRLSKPFHAQFRSREGSVVPERRGVCTSRTAGWSASLLSFQGRDEDGEEETEPEPVGYRPLQREGGRLPDYA